MRHFICNTVVCTRLKSRIEIVIFVTHVVIFKSPQKQITSIVLRNIYYASKYLYPVDLFCKFINQR
jgi:hypothetical protein